MVSSDRSTRESVKFDVSIQGYSKRQTHSRVWKFAKSTAPPISLSLPRMFFRRQSSASSGVSLHVWLPWQYVRVHVWVPDCVMQTYNGVDSLCAWSFCHLVRWRAMEWPFCQSGLIYGRVWPRLWLPFSSESLDCWPAFARYSMMTASCLLADSRAAHPRHGPDPGRGRGILLSGQKYASTRAHGSFVCLYTFKPI